MNDIQARSSDCPSGADLQASAIEECKSTHLEQEQTTLLH
jgi:hypothetical protein